jgi:S-DNA-T family DNA segregation ATPase FtsK/SpoIIIE
MARSRSQKKNGRTKGRKSEASFELSPRAKRELGALALAAIALISILAFFGAAGPGGHYINAALGAMFGLLKYLFPLAAIAFGVGLAFPDRFRFNPGAMFGAFVFMVSLGALINVLRFPVREESMFLDNLSVAGGYLGLLLSYPLVAMIGEWGSIILLIVMVIGAFVVTFNISMHEIAAMMPSPRTLLKPFMSVRDAMGTSARTDEEDASEDDAAAPSFSTSTIAAVASDEPSLDDDGDGDDTAHDMTESVRPKRRRAHVPIPLDLLEHRAGKPSSGDINGRMMTIKKTLENFGIPVEMGEISVGPTVTQFTMKPADGIKLTRITGLANDLALSLAAHPIRIEAPIPGKSLVGIEVPNESVAIVTLREVLESKNFQKNNSSGLTMCLGKDVAGEAWTADLAKMPHMLVAGATGSGKTVCLNALILSLLFQNSPDDLRLLLIDPKRVELPIYNGIPHLLTPAITEVPKIINALKWSIGEMDRRFTLLAQKGARDITEYNARAEEKMPYIVVVVDELADLMVASGAEVEASIIRLAQMSRAVGIHLIIATQRPSVDVITGLIKANITARVAFSVSSSTDSRTILDSVGAERLIGRGDMLFQTAELSRPKRIQCCFVGDRDIRQVVDFIKSQLELPADYDETITAKPGRNGEFGVMHGEDDNDDMYDEARVTVIRAGKASASYLQRRLKVGYARAARLLDMLEENGIIGPGDGAKPRQVLVNAVHDEDGVHVADDDGDEDFNEEDHA